MKGRAWNRPHALPVSHLTYESLGRLVVEIEPVRSEEGRSPALAQAQGVVQELRRAEGLEELFDVAAREVKRVTGYVRVMVYRFDGEGHGEVVAEALEKGQEPFLHFRFPASDISAQARRLYVQSRVRVIGDVGYAPVPVLSVDGDPLDMTFCALRSVSPMHLRYCATWAWPPRWGYRSSSTARSGGCWSATIAAPAAPPSRCGRSAISWGR